MGAPSFSFMPCAKVYQNHMNIVLLFPIMLLRGIQNIKIIETAHKFTAFFSTIHFHISSCKSETRFRPPTYEFQLFSFASKTIAGSINTTLGRPHRHRHLACCACFITFSAFLEIGHLDAFQGGSIEAPSLSFMPCAKAYQKPHEIATFASTCAPERHGKY